jgi:hypothetical protein
MTRDRDEAVDDSRDGDDLDPGFRARVRRRSHGGLRKMHREHERDESRDKEDKRRRHSE